MSMFTSVPVEELSTHERYKFMVGSIVPRPIAWVSTAGRDGSTNLAPFSFYNGLSTQPMCLMISVGYQADGTLKDTARNILDTGEFVVHQSPRWAIEQVHESASTRDYGDSEIEALGLETLPSIRVAPPRIKTSPVHLECKLHKKLELGERQDGGYILFVGEVVQVHILSEAYQSGRVLLDKLRPVARMGGPHYLEAVQTFQIPV